MAATDSASLVPLHKFRHSFSLFLSISVRFLLAFRLHIDLHFNYRHFIKVEVLLGLLLLLEYLQLDPGPVPTPFVSNKDLSTLSLIKELSLLQFQHFITFIVSKHHAKVLDDVYMIAPEELLNVNCCPSFYSEPGFSES
jgi:hypothetical protein